MKMKVATTCFVIGALLAPIGSYAADMESDRSHPGTFIKDSAITTKVKAKLAAEKLSSLARIKVDTDKEGVVYLSGVARTQEEANKAVSIASATEGVTSVRNDILIRKDD